MNVKNWKEEFEATLEINNDGNDYYYTWISLDSEKYESLEDLLRKYLFLDYRPTKVKIKAFEGAIFIQVIGDD